LAVLGSLEPDLGAGPDNKRTVMEFLHEDSLIDKDNPVIRLDEAHLDGADLRNADLEDARLALAYINGANLSNADPRDAELGGADLRNADLRGADLSNAELDSTYLWGADLRGAKLADANLSGANLRQAKGLTETTLEAQAGDLGLATMPHGKIHAGHYVTDEFVEFDAKRSEELGSPLSFTVGKKGWTRNAIAPAATGELYLNGPRGGILVFISPDKVFERSNPSEQNEAKNTRRKRRPNMPRKRHPNTPTSSYPGSEGTTGT
jgi:Pentapeptide repeats (8 copies)